MFTHRRTPSKAGSVLYIVVGSVMIVAGGIWGGLAASQTLSGLWNPTVLIGSTILTALGGALISWVSSASAARRDAVSELQSHISAVSQTLSQATSAIGQAMDYVVAGRISTDTAVALVSQNAEMVSGQISQLQILVGEKLDASPLVETHRTVVGLATKLASLAREGSPVTKTVLNEISAELTGVGERLQAGTATPIANKKARDWIPTQVAAVECPECSAPNSFSLSTAPGATAFVHCAACHAGFNIHRRLGGEVIVRMIGGGLTTTYAELAIEPASTGRREIAFECLECEASLTVSVTSDERIRHRTVICLECGSSYRVNLANENVTLTGRYEREIGEIVRWTGSQPWTVCPACQRHLRCGLRNDSGYFAFCKDDKKLMSISVAEFDEFKLSHARG